MEINDDADDITYCDGAGDGGIDVACLRHGEIDAAGEGDGDTWYLVQTKYGTAFQGSNTLLAEGRKVIETLDGRRDNLSSLTTTILERVRQFSRQAVPERDRIVLVFGTEAALNDAEMRTLNDVRAMGRERIGTLFDVEAVSVQSIFERLQETENAGIEVTLSGNLADSGGSLLVGAVSLTNLYEFLKAYRAETEDLDRLYEKNVRRFLGANRKVNRAIRTTLDTEPKHFGLYNNGITIVVRDFQRVGHDTVRLTEPFIVNGCQTTRSLWEVFHRRMEAGGSGVDERLEAWRKKASQGVIITKVVRVGVDDGDLLQNVTRYTNSQNAVREQDFHALNEDFGLWSSQMATEYQVFLEVQRGGWESYKARMTQNPQLAALTLHANALDLLKTYGAAWLRLPGAAFGSNADFAPNGSVFRKIMDRGNEETLFGASDLYAAYRLQQSAADMGFGRGSQHNGRGLTKFLFCFIATELLRDVMQRLYNEAPTYPQVTKALLRLFAPAHSDALRAMLDEATEMIDEYFTNGSQDCIFDEPTYLASGNDLNRFLKSDRLAQSEQAPRLHSLLIHTKRGLSRARPGTQSPRDLIIKAVR